MKKKRQKYSAFFVMRFFLSLSALFSFLFLVQCQNAPRTREPAERFERAGRFERPERPERPSRLERAGRAERTERRNVPDAIPILSVHSYGFFFIAQSLPDLSIPDEVGTVSEIAGALTDLLKNAFQDAYKQALIIGLELNGVLGGDLVNAWPRTSPESWSQNWQGINIPGASNSWGIPNLILALGNHQPYTGQVFTVSGVFLDLYGRRSIINENTGIVGYGIPVGDVFYSNGAAIQRFSRGRMILGMEGARFIPGMDHYFSALGNLNQANRNRDFGGSDIPNEISAAFIHSWAFLYSGESPPIDQLTGATGPINKVSFSSPLIIPVENGQINVNGFFYMSFNNGADILILLDSKELPVRAFHLGGQFLRLVLSRTRLSGLETDRLARINVRGGNNFERSLIGGFETYGLPLSNPLPLLDRDAKSGDPLFLEAQRFTRGWLVMRPLIERPITEFQAEIFETEN